MKLDYIKVDNNYNHLSKIKHLFEHAFPPVERPGFNMLMSFPRHEMYAVEDKGLFIGLVDIVKYEDTMYIFFLAIKKTYRGKGYGTKILKYLKNKYSKDYRLYLLAENPDIDSDNQKERINRISFYNHNDFKLSDEVVIEYGVNYRVLYLTNPVNKIEFIGAMRYLLGDEFFYKYYVHNVK